MVDFNKVFRPSIKEQIKQNELLLKLHEEQKNHCTTCVHMIDSDAPGVVIDYGECELGCSEFNEKIIFAKKYITCPYYKEDTDFVKHVMDEIKELKVKILKESKNE